MFESILSEIISYYIIILINGIFACIHFYFNHRTIINMQIKYTIFYIKVCIIITFLYWKTKYTLRFIKELGYTHKNLATT